MKYVIFKYKQLLMPVVMPDHVTHSQVKVTGAKPISAGFYKEERGLVRVYGQSESLKLKPGPDDSRILDNALNGAPTSSFLDL